ncbi:MAG: PEP-CTERM sorting domain-containing protein [Luteolibacter sp.]
MKRHHPFLLCAVALLSYGFIPSAKGALTLTIDTFTSTTLTFTVAGTLDAATWGAEYPGAFFITADQFASTNFYTGNAIKVSSTLKINGDLATTVMMPEASIATGYSAIFYIDPTTPLAAGTTISGTATFSGDFTSQPTLSLWSGLEAFKNLSRLEAVGTPVPEPSSLLLGAVGALCFLRRKR